VGNAIWETFPTARRPSYWLQYTERFGTSLEFINDQWYNIFWSSSHNSYYVHEGQSIKEPENVRLGTLARFSEEQEITQGEEHNRRTSLSTQGSRTRPTSRKSPIQENIGSSSGESEQELAKLLGLCTRTTPTPDKPQSIMSYAATITTTTTAQGHNKTTPFSTVGVAGGAPTWPTDSGGDQIMREGRNSQEGSANLGQAAPNWPAGWQTGLGPLGRPDLTNSAGSISGGSQTTQQRTTPPAQQQGQAPPASPAQAQGPPGGQAPAGA
jgi:hypothetical protein